MHVFKRRQDQKIHVTIKQLIGAVFSLVPSKIFHRYNNNNNNNNNDNNKVFISRLMTVNFPLGALHRHT